MNRHHHPTTFQDSANGRSIASGKLAGVYVAHGSFQWPRSDVDRMAGVFGISENPDPTAAKLARCIAVEPGAGTVASIVDFLHERRVHGHKDGMVYSDQADLDAIVATERSHDLHPAHWVAAPGKSPAEALALADALEHHHGIVVVAIQNLWANGYDESIIVRPDHPAMQFTPPHHFHATG